MTQKAKNKFFLYLCILLCWNGCISKSKTEFKKDTPSELQTTVIDTLFEQITFTDSTWCVPLNSSTKQLNAKELETLRSFVNTSYDQSLLKSTFILYPQEVEQFTLGKTALSVEEKAYFILSKWNSGASREVWLIWYNTSKTAIKKIEKVAHVYLEEGVDIQWKSCLLKGMKGDNELISYSTKHTTKSTGNQLVQEESTSKTLSLFQQDSITPIVQWRQSYKTFYEEDTFYTKTYLDTLEQLYFVTSRDSAFYYDKTALRKIFSPLD